MRDPRRGFAVPARRTRSAHTRGMDKVSQTPAPTSDELLAPFDADAFVTDTIGLVATQIIARLKSSGLVEASEVCAIVIRHLAPVMGRSAGAAITEARREVADRAQQTAARDAELLEEAAAWDADREWIATDQELSGSHEGSAELDVDYGQETDLLTEWLEATAV